MPSGSVVDLRQVKAAHKRFIAEHNRAFDAVLDDAPVQRDVRQHVGSGVLLAKRSGDLMNATKARAIRSKNRTIIRVTNNAKYAHAQETGSGLYGPKHAKYPIRPKRPGYPLRFFWHRKGMDAAFYKVMHPGVKPTHFLEVATDLAFKTRMALLRAAMRTAARHF